MERAIEETTRRRNKQIAFNLQNGITPRGVMKQVKELIDGVYDATQGREALKAAEQVSRYEGLGEKSAARELKRLEKQMLEHARNLEFEKAAQMRDQLAQLKEQLFGASGAASDAVIQAGLVTQDREA
jgi:excinuclease ABC subunit B